jgi:hypothetical protein
VLTLLVLALAPSVSAADPPASFAAIFSGTTVAFRPGGEPWDGAQSDLVLTAGLGRFVRRTLALELDLGPTFVRGDYTSFSLVPGVVWAFSPHAYLALRWPLVVDPEWTAYAAPGIGLSHTFGNGLTPVLEVNYLARVGHGPPDRGVTLTAGLLYSF